MANKKLLLTEKKQHDNGYVTETILHDSSNLLKTSYNYNTKRLVVTFKKGVYQYFDVPENIYEGFKEAESSGVYLNKEIKKFKFTPMAELSEEVKAPIIKQIEDLKSLRDGENPES